MTNVIPMPTLDVEMQLTEISALADAMLYMHEGCHDGDRKRVMDAETTILFIIKDKADTAQKALLRIGRSIERRAS